MSSRAAERTASDDQLHFAHALGEAIARRHMTLEQLSTRLQQAGTPVSIATLSYWQTGRSLPTRQTSLRAVAELERILRIPVGQLSGTLPGDTVSRWDRIGQAAPEDRADLVLQQMGFDTARHFTTSWVQDCVRVGEDGSRQVESTRQMLEPDRPGLDRIPLVFRLADPEDQPPVVEALTGCELGRLVQLDEHALTAVELLLPHPLDPGQHAALEYRVTWDVSNQEDHSFARLLTSPVRFHVLDVTFTGRQPASVTYFTTPTPTGEASDMLRQPLVAGPHVQMTLTDPLPGLQGLEWTFEDPAGATP